MSILNFINQTKCIDSARTWTWIFCVQYTTGEYKLLTVKFLYSNHYDRFLPNLHR